jgi:hypothetical protein
MRLGNCRPSSTEWPVETSECHDELADIMCQRADRRDEDPTTEAVIPRLSRNYLAFSGEQAIASGNDDDRRLA